MQTTCPKCDGEVDVDAQKCRHCSEWLVPQPQYPQNMPPPLPPSSCQETQLAGASVQVVGMKPPGYWGRLKTFFILFGTYVGAIAVNFFGFLVLANLAGKGGEIFAFSGFFSSVFFPAAPGLILGIGERGQGPGAAFMAGSFIYFLVLVAAMAVKTSSARQLIGKVWVLMLVGNIVSWAYLVFSG